MKLKQTSGLPGSIFKSHELEEAQNIDAEVFIDAPNFSELLASSSRALKSSSTISYEASFLNTAFMAIQTASNQTALRNFLTDQSVPVFDSDKLEHVSDAFANNSFQTPSIKFGSKFDRLLELIQLQL